MFGLTACGGGGGGKGNGNNPAPAGPALSIAAASVVEGDAATSNLVLTVSLSPAATSTVSVDYSSADASADQTDYTAVSGRLDIAAGDTSGSITVEILGDTIIESDEQFTVALSNAVNATIASSAATGTITNDDFPRLSIANAVITEGDSGTIAMSFDVMMDLPAIGDVTADYVSSNLVATAGNDFTAVNGTLTIAEGDTAATVEVIVSGDNEIELDEQFVVNLLNPSSNVLIDDDEATGLIINDDFPKLSIGPASVSELDAGTRTLAMPLTLDAAALEDLEVSYMTADGTAVAGDDYVAASGSVTIPAGDLTTNIPIETVGDTVIENSEAFQVSITGLQGAAEIEIDAARGTILDNDGPPSGPQLFGFQAFVSEGDSGLAMLNFLVLLDEPQPGDVSFDYVTADGSAMAPDDYVAGSGTVVIPAGATEASVVVSVVGDTDDENDEQLTLQLSNATAGVTIVTPQLSGTIIDDDMPSQARPRLNISGSSLTEGDSGTDDMVFAVSLSEVATTIVSADFVTEADTATEGADYTAVNGTVTFAIGDTAAVISVPVVGDTFTEDNERFRVRLSNLIGEADFGSTVGTGTIITDEPIARIRIADTSVLEGDSGTVDMLFTVSTFVSSVDPVSFDFTTSDGTAIDGEDYVGATGSAQIAAGEFETTFPVTVNGDTDNEDDETFTVTLDNLSLNATFANQLATGAVVNDDGSPGWQTPQLLGDGFEPDVDMNSIGNGAAVWKTRDPFFPLDDAATGSMILAGVLQPVIQIDLVRANDPKVVAMGGTEALAVWNTRELESSAYRAGTWTTSPVQDGLNFNHRVAGNESGHAVTVWQRDPVNTGSYYNNWRAVFDPVAGVFLPPEQLEFDDTGFAQAPFVAMNSAGDAMIVWTQSFSNSSLSGVYFDHYDAATQVWSGATLVTGMGIGWHAPMGLAMQSDGRVAMVVRADGFPNDSTELWRFDPTTSQWSSLGTANSGAGIPRQMGLSVVAVDGNDNLFVSWQQEPDTSSAWQIWARRFDNASDDWSSGPIRLEQAGLVDPHDGFDIAADTEGNSIVVWVQNVGTFTARDTRVRAARYTIANDDWGPAEQIDDENEGTESIEPRIAMDTNGNAVVVWQYWPEGQIGSNRFIKP
ncbi:MAG: Calx-beta domain-containing protein [Woeseiaceae bacterium]